MDPEPYDVFAVELSSFQLHYTDSMTRRGRGRAQRRRGPPRLVRRPARHGRLRRRQGPDLPAACSRPASTTSPTPRPSGWSARPTSTEGARADRLHARHARRSGWSASSTTSWSTAPSSPSGSRSAAELCTVADLRQPGARTSSPTRWPPPRWPAPTACSQAAVRDGLRALPARRPPDRDGRRRSAASPGSTTPRPPTRTPRCPRCWPTTRWCGSPAAWPRAPASTTWSPRARDRLRGVVLLGRDRDVIAEALARHAPDVPVIARRRRRDWHRTCRHGARGRGRARTSPSRATRSCWPRAAPPWTCSRTTPPGATPSPRRCAG